MTVKNVSLAEPKHVSHIDFRDAFRIKQIILMRIIRYFQTGYLLHLMTMFSVLMFGFLAKEFVLLVENQANVWKLILCGYGSIYFFTLIFFSQLDARSRYQNYKLIKDKFYEYGFDSRFLKPFVYSRCQRDAIQVAASEFNFTSEWKALVFKWGFRWYHILPHIVVHDPRVLLTRDYWTKTLFVKNHHSKYFLW